MSGTLNPAYFNALRSAQTQSTGGSGWGTSVPLASYTTGQAGDTPLPIGYGSAIAATYTPPVVQTTPPPVDVNAVIAAMKSPTTAAAVPTPTPLADLYAGSEAQGGNGVGTGELPSWGGFRDFIGSIPGAAKDFVGAVGQAMGGSPQSGGLSGDVTPGGVSMGPGTGDNTDPVGTQNGAADPTGMGGYKDGGYTGDAPVNTPVGVVHGQEEVISAPAVRAVGRVALEKINQRNPQAIEIAREIAERLGRRKTGPAARNDG